MVLLTGYCFIVLRKAGTLWSQHSPQTSNSIPLWNSAIWREEFTNGTLPSVIVHFQCCSWASFIEECSAWKVTQHLFYLQGISQMRCHSNVLGLFHHCWCWAQSSSTVSCCVQCTLYLCMCLTPVTQHSCSGSIECVGYWMAVCGIIINTYYFLQKENVMKTCN